MNTVSARWYHLLLALLLAFFAILYFPVKAQGFEVSIEVAPNIINIENKMATFVIHTNMPYELVDPYSVTLNGDSNYIYGWKMDSLGLFDAIILLDDVRDTLVAGEENIFLLKGLTQEFDPFWGTDVVFVIDKAMMPGRM